MKFAFWKKLREQFDETAGTAGEPAQAVASNPVKDVLQTYEAVRKAALSRDGSDDDIKAARRREALEQEERQIRQHRQEMFDDIVELHRKMGSGMDRHEVEQLAADLKSALGQFSHRQSDSLADHGLRAVLATIHDDALVHAWNELEAKLEAADLPWPPPPGLSPNASPQEIENKTRLHTAILHDDFLKYDLKLLAALIEGSVPSWRAVYPLRNSPVWIATCYQAVGGAYAARHYNELLGIAESRLDDIRRVVAERLGPALAPIEADLKKGVSSVNEALRLSQDANRIGETIAVEVFWDIVRPRHATA